ncbi:MAG: hypothetical protein OXD42_04760 [Rhodospirillaceae bacterium]|nr:hypothetical protein [Rhodospirillaceae bacterium]
MKRLIVAAIALSAAASPAAAQSAKDLVNDQKNTKSIMTYGMGYVQQRY